MFREIFAVTLGTSLWFYSTFYVFFSSTKLIAHQFYPLMNKNILINEKNILKRIYSNAYVYNAYAMFDEYYEWINFRATSL